ncbi:hypothetical protein Dimus_014023 [Dionaea muscipula]
MDDYAIWSPDDLFYLQEPFVDHYMNAEWTYNEDKTFEDTLAEDDADIESPAFYIKISNRLPWKTFDQVRWHYELLKEDIAMIEQGEIPLPEYKQEDNSKEMAMEAKGGSSTGPGAIVKRKRGVPWTEEEHRQIRTTIYTCVIRLIKLFLKGLEKCGRGDWRNISRLHVPSKTPTQVASHAQKYFRRLDSTTPVEKRRYSIHDTRVVNSTIVESAARWSESKIVREELSPVSGSLNQLLPTSSLSYSNINEPGTQYPDINYITYLGSSSAPSANDVIAQFNRGEGFW